MLPGVWTVRCALLLIAFAGIGAECPSRVRAPVGKLEPASDLAGTWMQRDLAGVYRVRWDSTTECLMVSSVYEGGRTGSESRVRPSVVGRAKYLSGSAHAFAGNENEWYVAKLERGTNSVSLHPVEFPPDLRLSEDAALLEQFLSGDSEDCPPCLSPIELQRVDLLAVLEHVRRIDEELRRLRTRVAILEGEQRDLLRLTARQSSKIRSLLDRRDDRPDDESPGSR